LEKQVIDFCDKSTMSIPQRSHLTVEKLLVNKTVKSGSGTRWNKQDIDKLISININDYAEEECQRMFKRSMRACISKLSDLKNKTDEGKLPDLPDQNHPSFHYRLQSWFNTVIRKSDAVKVCYYGSLYSHINEINMEKIQNKLRLSNV
jgi:hypothetical protein